MADPVAATPHLGCPMQPAIQWAEGKHAIKWTRLSCCSFAAKAVRLQLHALAYNIANFMPTLDLPEMVAQWSLTSLAGEAGEDLRQGRAPRPLRYLSDCRGRGTERTFRENPAPDRRAATTTSSSIGPNMANTPSPWEKCVWWRAREPN